MGERKKCKQTHTIWEDFSSDSLYVSAKLSKCNSDELAMRSKMSPQILMMYWLKVHTKGHKTISCPVQWLHWFTRQNHYESLSLHPISLHVYTDVLLSLTWSFILCNNLQPCLAETIMRANFWRRNLLGRTCRKTSP